MLQKLSIRQQLIVLISSVVFITLLVTSIIAYKISYNTYKKQLVNKTESIAQIIGVNNQSAIAFNDPETSSEILAQLKEYQNIELVCLMTPNNKIFATYVKGERPQWIIVRKKYKNGNYEFSDKHLELVSEINFNNETIGTIFIKVSLEPLISQMRILEKKVSLVIFFSYIFSLIGIYFISKFITKPILDLAYTTNKITSENNYNARVKQFKTDTEIALLYNGFNQMLDVIEQRNSDIVNALNSISEQKNEIEDQRDYIEDQRDYIEGQRNSIEKQSRILKKWNADITASINYASNIQNNMLLSIDKVKQLYNDIFILFKPRDIVSGDFYWCHKTNDSFIFCAADCTGHGVPGAMISVIGFNVLNQIILGENITEPNLILNKLDENIIKFFRKDEKSNTSDDGMDISICKFNYLTNTLSFAGANNPAYIVRNKAIIELKADRHSLGSGSSSIVRTDGFHLQQTALLPNDMIYIYSDGYMDQFGGEKGKKFMKKNFKKLLIEISDKETYQQLKTLENHFKNWIGDESQVDDIIILGVKV